jgi:hypothetical protein
MKIQRPMKKILFYLMIPTVFMAGCSKETMKAPENGKKVELGISRASLSVINTKAPGATAIQVNDSKIGIFQIETANGYVHQANAYNYNGTSSKWEYFTGDHMFLNNSDASVCAYYPYDAAITDETAVALTSQKYDPSKDISYATPVAVNNVSPSATFNMIHAYSKVTLKIRKDATYTGSGAVNLVSLNSLELPSTTLLNITNSTYALPVAGLTAFDPAIVSMNTYDSADASTQDATTYPAAFLMVPTAVDFTANITLGIQVDGIPMATSIPFVSLPKLEAGKNYNVTVVIMGTGLKVQSVTVQDWIDSDVTDPVYPIPAVA